jgi:F-type H+-transporting ATPase subunit a
MSEGASPLEHVVQHPLVRVDAHLGPLTPEGKLTLFSDHISMLLLAGLLLVVTLPLLVRRRRGGGDIGDLVPTGSSNLIEVICQYLRTEVAEPALGEHTDRFIKFIWSVFFFVSTVNLLGLLPLAPIAAVFGTHLGGTATGNLWVTGTLALTTLGMVVANGLRLGGRAYLAHFCPGPLWLAPLLIPVEIVGLIAKIFALAVRLFANMIAGHVLLAVLVGFSVGATVTMGWLGALGIGVPVVLGSLAITLLEIFVALLQAFIFTFLTTLFIGMAVSVHHDGEEHHEHFEEPHHGEGLLDLS